MPSQLSPEKRQILRDMLRRERQPVPIAVGLLRTLGRLRDHESLPLLLRYSQDDPAEITQAALQAISDLGDSSVAPVLVRVVQNPNVEQATRLQAAGTLLRIGGAGYRPLLRGYLESTVLPLRLQALQHLVAARTAPAELLAILASPSWPLPARLRLLDHCIGDPEAIPTLLGILTNRDDEAHIRIQIAVTLGQGGVVDAIAPLLALAADADTLPGLRMASIDAIGVIAAADAGLTLSQLADDPAQPPSISQRAGRALCQIADSRAVSR